MTERERLPVAERVQTLQTARATLEQHGYVVRKRRGARQHYIVRQGVVVCVMQPDNLVYLATQLTSLARKHQTD